MCYPTEFPSPPSPLRAALPDPVALRGTAQRGVVRGVVPAAAERVAYRSVIGAGGEAWWCATYSEPDIFMDSPWTVWRPAPPTQPPAAGHGPQATALGHGGTRSSVGWGSPVSRLESPADRGKACCLVSRPTAPFDLGHELITHGHDIFASVAPVTQICVA